METGLAVRPTSGATQTNVARPDPAPVRQAVATDLAAAQSVTASTNADAARHDAEPAQDNVRKIILDAHSREVIYQVVNAEFGTRGAPGPRRGHAAAACLYPGARPEPHAERSRQGRYRGLTSLQNLMLNPAPRCNRGRRFRLPFRTPDAA